MADVDLNVYRFDYDLTFVALLMHPDGTIYHTFGGRDWTGPASYLPMESLVDLLRRTLVEHAAYQRNPAPPPAQEPRTVQQIPTMAKRLAAGERVDCFHCHTVHDAQVASRRQEGIWSREDAFVWPDPIQLGWTLDRLDQDRLVAVNEPSPAHAAGLEPGDRLIALNGIQVATFGDVQRVLHEADAGEIELEVRFLRKGDGRTARLLLPAGWKTPTPEVFSWRAIKWNLSPRPGFGGNQLSGKELRALGLEPDRFAFRVTYLVTWGEHADSGRNARRAGIRKGDIVLSVAGNHDFDSVSEYHAWFRMTRTTGETVPVELLRDGKKLSVELPVVD